VSQVNQEDKILRLPQVMARVGLKKSAVYKMIANDEFPKQVKLGSHASGWLESEIQRWIMRRAGREPANDEQQAA
jgi:predicted DNA-binding transcriptional regulator AlpA